MDSLMTFFEDMSSIEKLTWIFICLGISWILEIIVPLISHGYHKWKHASVNLIFLGTSLIINLLFGIAILFVINQTQNNAIGLLFLFNLAPILELLIAVMVLDFMAQYLVHYLLHKVSFMWRFHMIHHSDTKVDATTGTRHHPGDYIFRELFGLFAIALLGAPIAFYVFYKMLTVPRWIDFPLSLVFITPNLHKFHHHFERPWTDTNFGNIFSFWDRLFGTLVYDDPKKVVYGLDVLDDKKSQNVQYQFKVPFDKSIKTDD